jgi:hypothetical protein
MFDATACYGMHLAPTPAICIETILDLKRLVAQATSESHDANIRLQHRSAESAGGANAKRPAEWAISAVSDTRRGFLSGRLHPRDALSLVGCRSTRRFLGRRCTSRNPRRGAGEEIARKRDEVLAARQRVGRRDVIHPCWVSCT